MPRYQLVRLAVFFLTAATTLAAVPAGAFETRFQSYFTPEQIAKAKTGMEIGERMHDLAFNDPSGKRGSIAEYRGKIVFINFWGAWCPPCRREMPSLAELHA